VILWQLNPSSKGAMIENAELRKKGHEFNAYIDENQFSFKGINKSINSISIPKNWGRWRVG